MDGNLGIEALSTEEVVAEASDGMSGGAVVAIGLGAGLAILAIGVAALMASSNAAAVEKPSEMESTTSPSKGGSIKVDEIEIVTSK